MSELLQAAKAVIDNWDCVSHARLGFYIEELRDAVERDENQDAAGFDDWWSANADSEMAEVAIHKWDECWTAAQQAERERLKDLFQQSSDWFEDEQMAQAKWLMEKIDDVP